MRNQPLMDISRAFSGNHNITKKISNVVVTYSPAGSSPEPSESEEQKAMNEPIIGLSESLDSLGKTALRIAEDRNRLLHALNRIRDKCHATLSQEDNVKYAVQTLDSIDEVAEKAIAEVEKSHV